MASSAPYIGSKLSLISNSEIRYEGILYTINTQESTIALKSVRCCGTEGRRSPEIPPSSEIYDFIIFRGQDIKDLTVLESASLALSAQVNDPAILSVNQRPAGSGPPPSSGGGGSGGKGGSSAWKGDDSGYGSGSYGGYGGYGRSSGGGYGGGSTSKASSGTAKASAKGSSSSGGYWGTSSGWGSSWGNSWDKPEPSYRSGGKAASYGGYGKGESSSGGKGKTEKGGKSTSVSKGGSKGEKASAAVGKGKEKGTASKGKAEKGSAGDAGGRRGGGEGSTAPVGELIPSVNEAVKSEYAEDFDYSGTNEKFNKVGEVDDSLDEKLKPLSGYDKGKSFFDNISCEATERAGDAERPKVDRNKARQSDRETFGDTRRPPRPAGGRRGGKGGARR